MYLAIIYTPYIGYGLAQTQTVRLYSPFNVDVFRTEAEFQIRTDNNTTTYKRGC